MWRFTGSLLSGNVCFWLGHFIDARTRYQDALSLLDPKLRAAVPPPGDPIVTILSFDYAALLFLGYLAQARLRRREALTESRRLSPHLLLTAPNEMAKLPQSHTILQQPHASLGTDVQLL